MRVKFNIWNYLRDEFLVMFMGIVFVLFIEMGRLFIVGGIVFCAGFWVNREK